MIEMAESFSRKEVLSRAEEIEKQSEGLMPSLIAKAGELGFCGVDTPEEFGGLGLSKTVAARILEFLSLEASFSVTYGVTSGIAQLGLVLFGTDEQRRQYLPKLASGEWIGAYALSEPNSGSDALSLSTRAVDKGNHYVLDGTKMWISNAKWAEFFLVMAKMDGDHVTAFLVERNHPGVSISREEHKMGLKGSSTARLVLEGAQIPKENLLHIPGKGHEVAFNALNLGRFKLGAMSLGPARESIYQSSGYAMEREQFGKAIGNFGLIREKFADMAAWYFAAESALYRTGANIDASFERNPNTIDGRKVAAEEFSVECSAVKVLCTELEAQIVDHAIQVYGGYGFTEEYPMARIYRDARVSRIYEGTNEINRLFMASRVKRKMDQGLVSNDVCANSYIGDLVHKAFNVYSEDQHVLGSISNLMMLAYAEQSARLRAEKIGGITVAAHNRFKGYAESAAAGIYADLMDEPVTIPAPGNRYTDDLAEYILRRRKPILGA